jgi:hypothetical protein
MQVEFLVNGGIQVILCPETDAEKEILKQLIKQENELTLMRGSVVMLNKTFNNSLIIASKSVKVTPTPTTEPEVKSDVTKEKNL